MAFFEQLGKKLSDAGQNVAQQTKNLADVTQLNGAIAAKEKKIAQLYGAIGQSYYNAHKDDPFAETLDLIQEINHLYGQIDENQEKIKQIKGIVTCENCGADVPPEYSFCNACGTRVNRPEPEPVVTADPQQRRCPACHAPVPEGSLFCNACGTRVAQPEPVVEIPKQNLCPACQAVLEEDAAFCTNCGTSVQSVE